MSARMVQSTMQALARRVRCRWEPATGRYVVEHYKRGDGWQPAATYAHSWCSVAAALDDQDRDGVRVEMAQREARRLAQPCAGECGGPVAGK